MLREALFVRQDRFSSYRLRGLEDLSMQRRSLDGSRKGGGGGLRGLKGGLSVDEG